MHGLIEDRPRSRKWYFYLYQQVQHVKKELYFLPSKQSPIRMIDILKVVYLLW